ncbi:hypothetical protein AD951_11135 [Acetobacter malorum]|uniref:Uncharacterized protein n=1 Tax=Acetobacter malorum TaxID=178901 RepID=A0A149UKL4_9PROT|nr:hypothetical protein AD951_11135 [Acetobacter malorum]
MGKVLHDARIDFRAYLHGSGLLNCCFCKRDLTFMTVAGEVAQRGLVFAVQISLRDEEIRRICQSITMWLNQSFGPAAWPVRSAGECV